jgi:type VI secretion system protein ImpI
MTLRLVIENMDRLPDGGPLRVEVKGRGLDLGRDAHLDWTLPDPSRHVSGKHCEIRWRDNDYWLLDVSRNGTFVNGAQFRLEAPYRLRDGDRLSIGPYVVAVTIEGGRPAVAPIDMPASDAWDPVGDSAPPESPEAYYVRKGPAAQGDFLDFATDAGIAPAKPDAGVWGAPPPDAGAWGAAPAPADESWLAPPAPPPPEVAPPPRDEVPRPTRPVVEPPPEVFVYEPPPPPPAPVAAAAPRVSDTSLIDRIAAAAGIPASALANRDPGEVADEIGAVLRLSVENLIQMAASRRQTKSAIRSQHHTMFRPTENNPIKFAADSAHAMEMMFGPPNRMNLGAKAAVSQAFDEFKTHNIATFGAMQGALEALFEDLAPEKIEASIGPERGLGAVISSRKARLWDTYAERWRALTKRADGRLNDAFMNLFAASYDKLDDKGG